MIPNLSELEYVLLDWDNTLSDSRPLLVQTVNRVLQEYHLPNWEETKQKRDKDLSFRDNFPHFFGPKKATEAYERYVELYLPEIKKTIHTFPKVKETLLFLRAQNIPLIILSNKDRRLLEAELQHLFDKDWFLRVVCGHEAPIDKPYPEQIFYALQGLLKPEEITPQRVWMIGDSPQDSRCALAANVLPIRIGKPIWEEQENSNSKAIQYYQDFAEFYAMLAKN